MNLEHLQEFLLWTTIINCALLTFSAILIMVLKKPISRMHGKIFNLGEEKIMHSLYMIIGIYKIMVFMFNIIPLIAVHIIR